MPALYIAIPAVGHAVRQVIIVQAERTTAAEHFVGQRSLHIRSITLMTSFRLWTTIHTTTGRRIAISFHHHFGQDRRHGGTHLLRLANDVFVGHYERLFLVALATTCTKLKALLAVVPVIRNLVRMFPVIEAPSITVIVHAVGQRPFHPAIRRAVTTLGIHRTIHEVRGRGFAVTQGHLIGQLRIDRAAGCRCRGGTGDSGRRGSAGDGAGGSGRR